MENFKIQIDDHPQVNLAREIEVVGFAWHFDHERFDIKLNVNYFREDGQLFKTENHDAQASNDQMVDNTGQVDKNGVIGEYDFYKSIDTTANVKVFENVKALITAGVKNMAARGKFD